MQVGLATGELLGEWERIPGLDENVQTPALDLRPLRLVLHLDGLSLTHAQAPVLDPSFVLHQTNPPPRSWRRFVWLGTSDHGREAVFRLRHCLVDPPRELLQACLEDAALGLGLGLESFDPPPLLALRVGEALLQRREDLVSAPAEESFALAEALLQALAA